MQATATVRDAAGQIVTDRPVAWASSASSVATVNASGLITALAVGTTTITASAAGIAGSARLDVLGNAVNFTLDNAYLTQAIQRYDGSIPLVPGGNPVLVNVYGSVDQTLPAGVKPRVRVELFSGTTVLATDEQPITGTLSTQVNPAQPIHQTVFAASVVQPGLRVRATINPGGSIPEASLTDNSWPRSGNPQPIPVQAVPVLQLHFVPVLLTNGASTGTVNPDNLPDYLTATRQMHPVSSIDADIGPVFSTDVEFGNGTETAWITILQQLDVARVIDGSARYYIGVVRPPPGVTFVQFGGYGYIPNNSASTAAFTRTNVLVTLGWFSRTRQTTELLAHELGHNMGRRHAPCGNAAGPDPGYPYQGGTIGLSGYDLYTWSKTGIGLPSEFAPASGDLMGYCVPPWISDYTYAGLLAWRGGVSGSALRAAPSSCPCLIVWGSVAGDSLRLEPSFVAAPPAVAVLPSAAGRYSLEGLGESGEPLFRLRFDPVEIDHVPATRHFTFAIPLPAGDLSRLTALRVRGGGRAIERRLSAAIGKPDLRLEPSGSARRLSWDARQYPLVVVRDAANGQILQLARGGNALVNGGGPELEVTVSNGVRSTTLRITTTGVRR